MSGAKTQTPPNKLSSVEQDVWLFKHIPHRVCAALTWLEMKGDWAMPPHPEMKGDAFHIWCIGRSVDEGRKAAMRWLIEFVGVSSDTKNKKPKPPNYHLNDVWIKHFNHGESFYLNSSDAQKLANVWLGCTQAGMHATTSTKHPDVNPQDLADALGVIIKHLDQYIYAPECIKLWDVVRNREKQKNCELS